MIFRAGLLLLSCTWACAGPADLSPCADGRPVRWEIAFGRTPDNVREIDFRPAVVPGYWQDQNLPPVGYAVYRLQLSCELKNRTLRIFESSAAAEAWLDGKRIASAGRPSIDLDHEAGRIAPWSIPLERPGNYIIFVSNHKARGGGILGYGFGDEDRFRAERNRSLYAEAFILGTLNAAGFFYLILFFARRRGAALPVFTLLMIGCTARSLSSNAVLEEFFPDRDWTDLRLLLEYATAVALMPPLYFWVIALLFRGAANSSVARIRRNIAWGLAFLYSLGGLCLIAYFFFAKNAAEYGYYQPLYVDFYLLPGLVLCAAFVLLLALERRSGSIWMILGFACILIATLTDAETTVQGRAGPLYFPMGLLGFAACFSVTVGLRIRGDFRDLSSARQLVETSSRQSRRRDQKRAAENRAIAAESLSALGHAAADIEESMSAGTIERPAGLRILSRLYSLRSRLEKRLDRIPAAPAAVDVIRYLKITRSWETGPSGLVVYTSRRELDLFCDEIQKIHTSCCTGDVSLLSSERTVILDLGEMLPGADPDLSDLAELGGRAGAIVQIHRPGGRLQVACEFQKPRPASPDFLARHAEFLESLQIEDRPDSGVLS